MSHVLTDIVPERLARIADAFRGDPHPRYNNLEVVFPMVSTGAGTIAPVTVATVPLGWEWEVEAMSLAPGANIVGHGWCHVAIDGRLFSAIDTPGTLGTMAIQGIGTVLKGGQNLGLGSNWFAAGSGVVTFAAQFRVRRDPHHGYHG